MTFRKDINGLRAIAVLAVVLFHFQVTGFSGGFVGVDVFFVISGYLMTAIIFNKLRDHRFSIIEFYLHRARRIIPALAMLCLALIVFGAYFLYFADYKDILKFAKNSIRFTSNISYYKESGYFATPASYNWLLHTWSLSVEWQFYMAYPIIISLCYRKFNEKATKLILLLLGFLSLIASIFYTPINPSAAFYLLPTRAWEMIAGGIVFLYPWPQHFKFKPLSLITGFLLITLSIFIFNDQYLWPGYLALIPVIGSMLIIYTNQGNLITDNAIFQWLGKISYSVYLWHWPIVVFLNTLNIQYDNIYITLCGIIASIIIGAISYYTIEIRFKLKFSYKIELLRYISIIVVIILSTTIITSTLKKYPQYKNSFSFNDIISKNYENFFKSCYVNPDNFTLARSCLFGKTDPSIIIMGDSHTSAAFISTDMAFSNKKGILLWGYTGCPVIFNGKKKRLYCDVFLKDKFEKLKNYQNIPILIAMRYSLYLNPNEYLHYSDDIDKHAALFEKNYTDTVCELSKNNPVYILKPIPEMNVFIPKTLMLQNKILNKSVDIKLPIANYQKKNERINNMLDKISKKCEVTLIDPMSELCSDGNYCLGSKDGIPIYVDDNHLTEYGSQIIAPAFKKALIMNQVRKGTE